MKKRTISANHVEIVRHARFQLCAHEWYEAVIEIAARAAHKMPRACKVILAGDAEIRVLNKTYRHKDKVTDVLAFPAADAPMSWPRNEHARARELPYLGEIFLCVPQIRRQAHSCGLSVRAEAARLLIHGFLHIWGYDHIKASDARIMLPLQDAAWARACTRGLW